jgi:ribonuclease P protein component
VRAYDSLRRQSEFARLYRRGRRATQTHFVTYHLQRRPGPMLRVGIAIGKAVGSAVWRNLVRRRIQYLLDTLDVSRASDSDILIVAKPGAAQLTYAELELQLKKVLAGVTCGT